MRISSNFDLRPVRREHLLKPQHLVLLGLVLLLTLFMLRTAPSALEDVSNHPDPLALKYLRLLSSTRPNDGALKLRLAKMLFELGRWDEASRIIDSMPYEDAESRRLRLRIHLAQVERDIANMTGDPELKLRLVKEIEALILQPLSVDDLTMLATSSLRIGRPDLAARLYLRLAEIDPRQSDTWLALAAQQLLASGQPGQAGLLYDRLAQDQIDPKAARHFALLALTTMLGAGPRAMALVMADRYTKQFSEDMEVLAAAAKIALANGKPAVAARYYDLMMQASEERDEQRRFALLVVKMLTAADQPLAALQAVRRYLAQFPHAAELLRPAIKLALGNDQLRQAQTWGRTLLRLYPNSYGLLANQFSVEVASGDLRAALQLANRLVEKRPDANKNRVHLAEVSEWSGHPAEALEQWTYLALHTNNRKYLDRAVKMAPQLYDMEKLAELLALKARRGRMTNSELASLIETYEEIGEPEQLVKILDAYLFRYPDHREAWEGLAEVHERRGDLKTALSIYERQSRQYGSNVKETSHRAELLWTLGSPRQAYVLMRDALDHAGVATTQGLLTHSELASVPPDQHRSTLGEKQRQAFLNLTAELLWHSEPRPESVEEYRKLWQAGAMLTDSTWRYLQLTKTRSLTDEMFRIATSAYSRFKDPEFLMWAMNEALSGQHWEELEQLVQITREHNEEFAGNKNYYLILAEYYQHQGEYDHAQRAYLRVIALDSESVAARVGVLALLTDHGHDHEAQRGVRDRWALQRYLTDWRHIAENEPALWLPFATGWALLGHSKEAMAYYQREWTTRPTDHLWLVGYISTLDALSRSSDVRVLRRFAIKQLQPEAERASHPNATKADREVLQAYAELVRDTYGAGKGSRWMAKVLRTDLDADAQKGIAAVWRNDGESAEANYWVTNSQTVARKNPWGRFRRAPKPAQTQLPATIMDAGSDPGEMAEPPPAPLRVLENETNAGEKDPPERPLLLSVEAGIQSINDLLILPTSVSMLIGRGRFAIGGHVGVNQLFLNSDEEPDAASTEVDVGAYGMWRHHRGRLEAGVGANLRSDANLFYGWVSDTISLPYSGTLKLGVHLNELVSDTRWLRIYSARHRASAAWNTSFLGDGIFDLQGSFYHYHTRTNEALGLGFNVDAEVGYRVLRARPLWTMRVTGSYTRNFNFVDELPDFGKSSSSAMSVLDALPLEFLAVGAGTRIEHRFPGVRALGAGRARYFVDGWVGYMWPLNTVGFDVQAGVGVGLPRKQEMRLTSFVSNNHWLGPGVINAGVSLSYLVR